MTQVPLSISAKFEDLFESAKSILGDRPGTSEKDRIAMDRTFGNIYTGVISVYILWILQRQEDLGFGRLLLATLLTLCTPLALYVFLSRTQTLTVSAVPTPTHIPTPVVLPVARRRSSASASVQKSSDSDASSTLAGSESPKCSPFKRSNTVPASLDGHATSHVRSWPHIELPRRSATISSADQRCAHKILAKLPCAKNAAHSTPSRSASMQREASATSTQSFCGGMKSKSPSRSIPSHSSKASKIKRIFSIHLHKKRRGSV